MQVRVWKLFAEIRNRGPRQDLLIYISQNFTESFDPKSATMIEDERGTFQKKFLESLYISKSESFNLVYKDTYLCTVYTASRWKQLINNIVVHNNLVNNNLGQ